MDIREILKKSRPHPARGHCRVERYRTDTYRCRKIRHGERVHPARVCKKSEGLCRGQSEDMHRYSFPNGYNTTAAKVFETEDAVANGADEIDMVINVGELKSGNTVYVENEIKAVRAACEGKILKVIIETCLLTENEKITMCDIVTRSGADYIKTSTGFSTGGATFDDIKLFSEHIGSNVKMKAAGGISSLEDAEKFIALGCDRLGTSRIVKLAKGLDASGY